MAKDGTGTKSNLPQLDFHNRLCQPIGKSRECVPQLLIIIENSYSENYDWRRFTVIKDDKTDKPAILETVFDLLRNFTQFISYSNEAAELKTMEFYLLLYIGLKGPQNMSALAKAYLMTKSNITVLVDDLENKSYVGREKSERDRRVTIIKLTRKGEAVFKEFSKNFSELIDIFLENVQEDDLVVMTDGFERIARLVVQRGLKRRKSGS